jgi:membrane protein implicated in regulation of membrane protease activity
MILLQESIEPNGILTEVVQQGIAFAILVVIIIVLARRVIKLENKIEEMIDTRFEEVKDNAIIIKDATSAMKDMAHTRCNYEKS